MFRNFIFFVFLFSLIVPPAFAQETQVWTEDWDQDWQSRWFSITGGTDCSYAENGLLIQNCQSGAIQSLDRFPIDQRIEFSGTIFSQPGVDSSNLNDLAHHVLIGADDGPDGEYCGVYIAYDEQTDQDKVFRISYPYVDVIGLVEHHVHDVKIIWEPRGDRSGFGIRRQKGICSYYIDNELLESHKYGFMLTDVALWQGASSVNPGQGNDDSTSYAEHGPITVSVGE